MTTVRGVCGLESEVTLDRGVEGGKGREAMVRTSEGLIRVKEESWAGKTARSVERRRAIRGGRGVGAGSGMVILRSSWERKRPPGRDTRDGGSGERDRQRTCGEWGGERRRG